MGTGNKVVTVGGVNVSDGNGGGNYTITYANNTTSTITPSSITISTSPVTKSYDGTEHRRGLGGSHLGTLFTNAGTGVQDSLSGGAFAFTNPNASAGNKTVTVSGVTVNDGTAAGTTPSPSPIIRPGTITPASRSRLAPVP